MKKNIISIIIAAGLLSGAAFANEVPSSSNKSQLTVSQERDIDNIAYIGSEAMQDIQLARVALFNGDTVKAKKFLMLADKKINDDKTNWENFIKKNKTPPIDNDEYVIINATISVNEDFQSSETKTKAINEANKKLAHSDKKGAIETLRLAGITVMENQVLMPLQQTRTDIQKAITLFNDGKYYQTNLMLLSAEQGVIVESEVLQEE